MKIGIVGTGNMGRSLGVVWAEQGHEVYFGARDIAKAKAAADLVTGRASYGSNQAAARFGEVIYYNPRDVNPNLVLEDVSVLDGKIVIDSHNGPVPANFAYEAIVVSRSELLQQQLPKARIVKAFNTMAQEVFEAALHPLQEHKVACFIAGDDSAANNTVAVLATAMGLVPILCGDLRQARLLEGAADLIRLLIGIKQDLGATFSITSVRIPSVSRLGGRQVTNLS